MSANKPLCSFSMPSLKRDFKVLSVHGWEEVSRGFLFSIEAQTDSSALEYSKIIFQDVKFDIHPGDKTRTIHGTITECQVRPGEDGLQIVTFEIRPALQKLAYSIQCRVFQKQTLKEIITEVLKANNYPIDRVTFKSTALESTPEFVVQYNESDLNFISRLLERAGVAYYFKDDGSQTTLLVTDDNAVAPKLDAYPKLRFLPRGGMVEEANDAVYDLVKKMSGVTGNVSRKAYGYQNPDSNLQAEKKVANGTGTDYQYTSEAFDMDTVTARAAGVAAVNLCASERLGGVCSCYMIQAGMRITIDAGTVTAFSGEFFLVRLKHSYSHAESASGAGKGSNYEIQFEAVSGAVPFRPQQSTERPKVSGVIPAHTGGEDPSYAYLDDAGRYRVKFPFDKRVADNNCLSLPVRLSQPYSGADYGMHFPLHKGTELLIAFEEGDIDRPVAVGTVPNPVNPAPTTSTNVSQNILKSALGHKFTLDDNKDAPVVEIITAGGHLLRFVDTKDTTSVLMQTKAGHKFLLDDKNQQMVISSPKGETVLTMNTKDQIVTLATKEGHMVNLDDKKNKLTIQSAKKQMICLDDEGKKMTLQDADGKHIIQIDGGGKINVSTEGDINIKAKGALNMSGKTVSIKSDSSDVNIKSAGKLNSEGMNVNVKATQKLIMEAGMDASLKGGTNLALEGTINANLKAGVALKATGTMANLEASGIATIKGAMVMVN